MTCSILTSAGFAGCIEEIGWTGFKDSSKTTITPKPKTSTCANWKAWGMFMSVALSNFCHGCGAGFGVGIDRLIAERVDVISPIGG